MKKFAFFAIAALATFAACQKEVEVPLENQPVKNTYKVTITAGLAAETRTAYDAQGKFSWVEGDQIGVLVTDGTTVKQVTFTTAETGPVVDFTGEVEEGFTVADHASYPFKGDGMNDFIYDPGHMTDGEPTPSWRIYGSIKPSLESPLSTLPLFGTKDADGNFQFVSATGVVKFTVANVPIETAFAYMDVPSDSEANLNGWYDLSDGYLKMSAAVEPWKNRYNWNVPTGYNETIDYYFFLPEGTLPVGSKFYLCNENYGIIKSFEFKQAVEVVRNVVTNVAPVEFEAIKTFTVDDVIGKYDMEVTESWIGGLTPTGDFVIEASDNAELGNVMITKIAGLEGRQYGTFDGLTLTFPCDQLFCANPYEDAEEFPFLALDAYWYGTGVVDAVFEVLAPGKLVFVRGGDYGGAYDAIGFRQTTEDLWFNDNHNGGYPWSVSYGSLVLTREGYVASYNKGEEIRLSESMLAACGTITWDGGGVPALCDNDASTYWHSDYYYAIKDNDPVFGIWIDITLEAEIDAAQFKYQVRSGNAGARPTRVVIGVSNDGNTWKQVGEAASEEMSGAAAGAWVTLPAIDLGGGYRHLRFGIADSASPDDGELTGDLNWDGYKKCTNLAELKLIYAE